MTGELPSARKATPDDASAIAEIHCAAWRETYSGLLPEAEIDRACNIERRQKQWRDASLRSDLQLLLIDGSGFVCMGPQRDPALLDLGFPDELYAIYLLRKSQGKGLGAALLTPLMNRPFTILVLAGNTQAIDFYQHLGARLLMERPEKIGSTDIVELVLVWSPAASNGSNLAPSTVLR